jgi:cyclophilin family peptidyl-prolyl cis-trans isomerase
MKLADNWPAEGRMGLGILLVHRLSILLACSVIVGSVGAQELPGLGDQQVVFVTEYGEIVLEVFPGKAPNHVRAFLTRIRSREYVGTLFHRAIQYGIVQGGDPLTRDPSKRDLYGTGGLFELRNEFNDLSHVRGTVSAVLVPGNIDSAGSQFFVCVTDQVQLDGQYTIFGRVVEGMKVVEKISLLSTDEQQRLIERVEITDTYERDRPPPPEVPFSSATAVELGLYHVVIETNLGDIELAFYPEQAPNHVRQFLHFAQLGLYDGTTFHRVVPGFVVQGGSFSTRSEPVAEEHKQFLEYLVAEFNEHQHVRGTLSMARAEDPNSALDSFFIVLAPQPTLDNQYTVFGYVRKGIETVDGISQVPVQDEAPIMPVTIAKMRVVKTESAGPEN